jgi:hypothetical protein
MGQVFFLLALTAVPFWAMTIATAGFSGEYSREIAAGPDDAIPYMHPYALRSKGPLQKMMSALSFATILEDKGKEDLTSQMHYNPTTMTIESDIPRDYFLLGALNWKISIPWYGGYSSRGPGVLIVCNANKAMFGSSSTK